MLSMNGAQFHLLLNHLPVLIPLISVAFILGSFLLKSLEVREAGAWLLALGALVAIPVYLTGESAENVVKNYPNISRLLIEDHEASALSALIALETAGAVSLAFIFGCRTSRSFVKKVWPWGILIAVSLFSFGFMAQTAHLGGFIRHEEIRNNDRF
jgi:uncharacterized membrane protein